MPPSRSPEARRAEYLRSRDSRLAYYARVKDELKDSPQYAKKVISQATGLAPDLIPDELAEAKLIQLRISRTVRAGQEAKLYPVICERYLQGMTTRQLAAEYGFERARISAILKQNGITPRRRPVCKNGHEMIPENSAFTAQGWRRCRKCARDNTRKHEMRKRATALDMGSPIV